MGLYKETSGCGSYMLPPWNELCQNSKVYGGGQVSPLFTLLGTKSVIPAVPNPFSKDSDNDYYPDLIDKDKLKANPMYINDKALDDTNFHNGQTIMEHKSDEYTDGNFVADQKNGTGKYVFSRKPTATYRFVLTPKKEGFYRFSGGLNMDVKYTKGLIIKQTVKVKPEPDGTYLLKKNVKYTITMRCVKSADTNFTARQDNWGYAPNGGLWAPTKYSNASLNSSAFGEPIISGKMYVPAKRVISLISDLYGNTVKTELVSASTQEDLRKQIEYVVRNNGMSDGINVSDIVFLIGGGLGAIQAVDKLFNYLDRYGFERASVLT